MIRWLVPSAATLAIVSGAAAQPARGGDAADVDLGVIRGNATTKKIAMRELEAILAGKGR